jgi:hypothetical protein
LVATGFRFSLAGNQTCLNLLIPSWTLDSSTKFGGAMVGVFFAAFLVEGFSKLRHKIVRSVKQQRFNDNSSISQCQKFALRWAVTVLHGLQALFGYTLMLVTMTFSIELLFAVVLGLMSGYALFFQTSDFFRDNDVSDEEVRAYAANLP